jgi:nucleoside-diphosphate-sugar epimerase
MHILIVGSGGYIGQNLARKLTNLGANVIEHTSSFPGLFEPTSGIVTDSFSILNGTDCIIYLSQSPYYRQLPDKLEHLWGINTLSPIKIANLARKSGVKKFIYASTGNVYTPSFLPLSETDPIRRDDWYSLSKIQAEECLLNFSADLEVVCTRIFGVYGPNQTDKLIPNLINAIKSELPVNLHPQPNANQYGLNISLCYIDDLCDIFTSIATSQVEISGVINVAGNEVINIGDIATEIGSLLNINPIINYSEAPRKLDLISNNSKLINRYNPIFTPFVTGIKKTLDL